MKKFVEIIISKKADGTIVKSSRKSCKVEFPNDDDKDDYIVSIKHLNDGSTVTTKAKKALN